MTTGESRGIQVPWVVWVGVAVGAVLISAVIIHGIFRLDRLPKVTEVRFVSDRAYVEIDDALCVVNSFSEERRRAYIRVGERPIVVNGKFEFGRVGELGWFYSWREKGGSYGALPELYQPRMGVVDMRCRCVHAEIYYLGAFYIAGPLGASYKGMNDDLVGVEYLDESPFCDGG